MSTEAKRAGNARHLEKLGRIDLRPYKEEVEQIKAAAADAEQSTSAYIMQAVRERMERENAPTQVVNAGEQTDAAKDD